VAFSTNGQRGNLPALLAAHPDLGMTLAEELRPLLTRAAELERDQHVVGSYRVVAAATDSHGVDLYAQCTYEVYTFAGGRLSDGSGTAYSGPVRIRLSRSLHAVAIDETWDDSDAARLMPGWALTRIDHIDGDWLELQETAGRWAADKLPTLVQLPKPDHANPLRDQARIYSNGPLDDTNRPDPANLYAMGAIPSSINGFAVRQTAAPKAGIMEKLMASPDGRFTCYISLDDRYGLHIHDVLKHVWLAVAGPSLAQNVVTWTAAWAGDTLVFDIVDVGFSQPRPPVLTKVHVEIDLPARRVTRVVPFGPYAGNWPL
jgi:hypothetical protein